jgi:ribulose-bisphosphate carboxylase large chain
MVSGRFEQIEKQVRFAAKLGVRGVLIAPMLVGPDTVRYLSDTYGLMIMGHPALTGTYFHDRDHGMSPAVLLGTLFRLLGVDISVFPNCGGRFPFTETDCRELAGALRREERTWHPAWPCPAGGMSPERLDTMAAMYGTDTVFLVGGALMRQPGDLSLATATFMKRIRSMFEENVVDPAPPASSCELTERVSRERVEHDSVFRCEDFRWSERGMDAYKPAGVGDFRGISRGELVGGFGENTAFDVRYFEIEPGGYSSLERHVHEHVIIGVRGSGILVKGERRYAFGVNDIGYVKPSEPHQLRNEGTEPFGFYCIVDHQRDRPVPIGAFPSRP